MFKTQFVSLNTITQYMRIRQTQNHMTPKFNRTSSRKKLKTQQVYMYRYEKAKLVCYNKLDIVLDV